MTDEDQTKETGVRQARKGREPSGHRQCEWEKAHDGGRARAAEVEDNKDAS